MAKILIADDHTLIREGFMRLIENEVGMEVVGEAENGNAVIEFLREHTCDVIVMDLSMPGRSGLELLKDIKTGYPGVKILILTIHPEDRFAMRAFKAGADGYLTKLSASTDLLDAIRKVNSGGKYVTPTLAEKMAFSLDADTNVGDHEILSDREFEVFQMIAKGHALTRIAEELHLSNSTVNTYRSRILEKMGLNSNADIIHHAIKNNLLD